MSRTTHEAPLPTLTLQIHYPKKTGLINDNRPLALVVNSPFDAISHDPATVSKTTQDTLNSRGYTVINRSQKRLTFFTRDIDASIAKLGAHRNKNLVIYFLTHSITGWVFGNSSIRNPKQEFQDMIRFSIFINHIQEIVSTHNITLTSIVLDGCNTGNECMPLHAQENTFLISPARMISYLLPEVKILGYIGQNAAASTTDVFLQDPRSHRFIEQTLQPENSSVIYCDGVAREYCNKKTVSTSLFIRYPQIPLFLRNTCEISHENILSTHESQQRARAPHTDSNIYFDPSPVLERAAYHGSYFKEGCYGNKQISLVKQIKLLIDTMKKSNYSLIEILNSLNIILRKSNKEAKVEANKIRSQGLEQCGLIRISHDPKVMESTALAELTESRPCYLLYEHGDQRKIYYIDERLTPIKQELTGDLRYQLNEIDDSSDIQMQLVRFTIPCYCICKYSRQVGFFDEVLTPIDGTFTDNMLEIFPERENEKKLATNSELDLITHHTKGHTYPEKFPLIQYRQFSKFINQHIAEFLIKNPLPAEIDRAEPRL